MIWFRAKKKSYEIWARIAQVGETIYNILEGATYVAEEPNDIVLSGTAGEQWVISREKFAKTYHVVNGELTFFFKKVATNPSAGYVFVQQVKTIQQVRTSWGAVLTANDPRSVVPHGDGDFIVASPLPNGTPNLNDMWVVNGTIFRQTYNIEGAPSSPQSHNCIKPLPPISSFYKKGGTTGIYIGGHKLQNSYVKKFFENDFADIKCRIVNHNGKIENPDCPTQHTVYWLTNLYGEMKVNFFERWNATQKGSHEIGIWYVNLRNAKALYFGCTDGYDYGINGFGRGLFLNLYQFKKVEDLKTVFDCTHYEIKAKGVVSLGHKHDLMVKSDADRLTKFVQHFDDMISKVES